MTKRNVAPKLGREARIESEYDILTCLCLGWLRDAVKVLQGSSVQRRVLEPSGRGRQGRL